MTTGAEKLKQFDCDMAYVDKVDPIRFHPHPYCITPKRLEVNDGAYLDVERAEQKGASCGIYYDPKDPQKWSNGHKAGYVRCTEPYDRHVADYAIMVVLKRNVDWTELQPWLVAVAEQIKGWAEWAGKNIEGFGFVCKGHVVTQNGEVAFK